MEHTFRQALAMRRSYYELEKLSPIDDKQIEEIIRFAAKYIPSAFDSRSTRLVLLLHESHTRLWNIVKSTLQAIVPQQVFPKTANKIEKSFAAGYGTVLFFEDETVTKELQKQMPTYAETFPLWAEHTSAMHQLAIWTMLEEAGFGVSLQHYNPLIDTQVREEWNLPQSWRLIAQMPFGKPEDTPPEKDFSRAESQVFIFDK